jgi:sugar/nucleoside kinase (ribokinase family)
MSLVIVGSVAFDTIETPLERRERIVGGSCTYCALAASYFTRPKIVAVVGEDFPAEAIAFFKKRRVDLKGLKTIPGGKTFFWQGRYGQEANERETVKLDLNVFADFRPEIPPSYRSADTLFLANIDPDLQEAILRQIRRPRLTAMDTIDHWIENKAESVVRVLREVDVFFANEEEIRLLTGERNLITAGRTVLTMGPSFVVLKKGEHGVLVFGRDLFFGLVAHPCGNVVDPTGAGDSFAGGFLGYLDSVKNAGVRAIRRAAAYGSVMASFTIEDFGIDRYRTLGTPEVEERLAAFRKQTSF